MEHAAQEACEFYIDGQLVVSENVSSIELFYPSMRDAYAVASRDGDVEANAAVAAARAAFKHFGPTLSTTPFDNEADAIKIDNDTVHGLTGFVQTHDIRKKDES